MSRLINFSKIVVSLAIFALVPLASATLARADTITLILNTGSTLPNQHYGTITLTTNGSGGIAVNIQLDPGNRIVNTGFDASVAFNSTTGGRSVSQVFRVRTHWLTTETRQVSVWTALERLHTECCSMHREEEPELIRR